MKGYVVGDLGRVGECDARVMLGAWVGVKKEGLVNRISSAVRV